MDKINKQIIQQLPGPVQGFADTIKNKVEKIVIEKLAKNEVRETPGMPPKPARQTDL